MKKRYFSQVLIVLILILTHFNFYSQNVVINEIITDPQTDWSSNNFDGTDGGATISNVDEAIELYIKTDGLDLTGWTIELLDGSNVIGDLTNTGAFDVSNYISSNGGSFTNTKSGDFLVLGNVNSSGAMNNNITINLKDASSTLIDTVTLGGGAGEAPTGNAATIGDESVMRLPNGTDTNTDNLDFSKGVASLGRLNPNQISWDGSSNRDWNTASNWAHGSIPISTDNVFIPNVANSPIIGSSAGVEINNLDISSSSLTIEAGGSLIVNGNSTGNVTYNRTVGFVSGDLKGWFLMASPVTGQTFNDAFVSSNDIATSGTNRGIASYVTLGDSWNYLQSGGSGSFHSGQGYAIKKGSGSGTISFTGTINTDNAGVNILLSSDGNRFNLLGNPYTSYINSATFLNNESSISETKTIWVWNQTLNTNGAYEVKVIADAFVIAPGQGFFVKANSGGGTFNFSESNQRHNTDTFQRTLNTEVKLSITDGSIQNYCKIYYLNSATKGFDAGYDGELFNGTPNSFAIYSHLVSNSQGKNYQIQSLPLSGMEGSIIPIGVNASSGKLITISADTKNLPKGVKVYLEDKIENSFTRLDHVNTEYTFNLTENLSETGRFYIHVTSNTLNTKTTNDHQNVGVYIDNHKNLKITGVYNGLTDIKVFNILGKEIFNNSFNAKGQNYIDLPNLDTGVYIIRLETQTIRLIRKVIIK